MSNCKPKYWQKDRSVKNIYIESKEWFDKLYGSSYFSSKVIINHNEDSAVYLNFPMQYGYGDRYIYSAIDELVKLGFISSTNYNKWRNKITANIQRNCTKREVINHGLENFA